jgi:23S rRNA pseudouridine1911/1915/1917 synthase
MIQRLDRETSGVILFSISPRAHKPLTTAITARALHKTYLALVSGSVPPGEQKIRSLLARSHRDNSVRSVLKGGQEAETHFHCLAASPVLSLVEVTPITGRMHQIRVHLAEAGFPLIGDKRYGGLQQLGDIPLHRHMLHARRLDFQHPVSGRTMTIEAPLPADFQELLDHFQLSDCTRKRTEDLC